MPTSPQLDTPARGASRHPGRLARRARRALWVLSVAALLAGAAAQPARAQSGAPNIAELRLAIAVRDAQSASQAEGVVAAAQAYLAEFPRGRYADEMLLALAQGYANQNRPELALQTHNRLIEGFQDSPFREQAMSETLPLLEAQGDRRAAFARVDALVKGYPNSLQRSEVLLWKADTQETQGEHADALATLGQINPQEDLVGAQEADYYRVQTLALVRSGQSAWTALQRYLSRDDSPEHKAEVLMLVGEVARKAERPDEALRFYSQVAEDYPVPAMLPEALFWRADLFARTRLTDAPEQVLATRRETAIGYYAAYLKSADGADSAHRPAALLGRGALLRDAGRHEAALADYEQAIALDARLRTDTRVLGDRVGLLQALNRPEQAVALLEAARKDATLPLAARTALQVRQAALHYEREQCEQVEALLNPMPVVADPAERSRAFFLRGFCRYRRGEWERATFDLEGLVNDPAYQALALHPLLEAYEKSRQDSRLVNLAEELLRAGRVPPEAPLLMRLADGYARLGEPALMLSAYQRLEQADPTAMQAPEIQLRMGEARERLEQRDAAVAHYRAVLERPANARPPTSQAVYVSALEHLQRLYVDTGRESELAGLHAAAERRITEADARKRLDALRGDVDVTLARRELEAGQTPQAIQRLEAALPRVSAAQPERRAAAAALLMTAYARGGAGDKAAALYKQERDGQERDGYRAALAGGVIAAVQAQPQALEKPAQRTALIPLYRQALADLPAEQTQQRYEASQVLDRLYREQGDHAARAALVTALLKDGYSEAQKREQRQYQGQIYKDWGQALLDKGDLEGAQFQLTLGLELLKGAPWRERYELVSPLSRVQLHRGQYTELVLMNEGLLAEVDDPGLAAGLRHFLGQVYVQWGKAGADEGNAKSARMRYAYALDHLPESDWQRRLAATAGLATVLQAEGRDRAAAAAYEAVLPQVKDPAVHQQYALYLGRLYAERLNQPARAAPWFKAADRGGKDALSLEAGYLWADQDLAQKRDGAALTHLKALAGRGIAGSTWEVPIHYRIAVLHHQAQQLAEALPHYRTVAGTRQEEARRLYPRSIEQSKQQVQRIEAYLRASGGDRRDVAVPSIKPE